ncbi:MAG: M20/M25/M40 family metallo-hydrolase [Thermoanaerobaculum sp.]|nr:M20/M25/M40 family metallo-hydrolase [Thermoanaerobaculum sp.]MDW7966531.1 M20/M25/M40 family metallo-hydrolase [Thermoanaerobaculum sp.]
MIGEIPGGDLKDQVVMAGAHLDSWHAGSGATNNAASCAVVLEAARILKVLGVQPRRTIRFALWNSEEQGLNGSRAYVCQHLACWELKEKTNEELPEFLQEGERVLVRRKDFDKLAAVEDLGAKKVAVRAVGGTDHLSFDRVGLPGFQFIQDGLDCKTRTHHTDLDVFVRLQREDLIKNSIVLATFLYHAAMREQPIPRKPVPDAQSSGER